MSTAATVRPTAGLPSAPITVTSTSVTAIAASTQPGIPQFGAPAPAQPPRGGGGGFGGGVATAIVGENQAPAGKSRQALAQKRIGCQGQSVDVVDRVVIGVGIDRNLALRRLGDVGERIRRRRGNNAAKEAERIELVESEPSARVEIFEDRDASGEITVEDEGRRRHGQRRGGR